jgi:ribonuclease HI
MNVCFHHLECLDIRFRRIVPKRHFRFPSWSLMCPPSSICQTRRRRNICVHISLALALAHVCLLDYIMIYTDGSFFQGSSGCVVMYEDQVFKYCLYNFNMYMAILYAIFWTLMFIQQQSRQCYHLCNDSLSASQSLWGRTMVHLDVLEIMQEVFHLHEAQSSVEFCWVPGHTGVTGTGMPVLLQKRLFYLKIYHRPNLQKWCSLLSLPWLSLWQHEWTRQREKTANSETDHAGTVFLPLVQEMTDTSL